MRASPPLLNTLAGYDRAIVTDIPGTTRDTGGGDGGAGGIPLRLIDTAGLRDSSDPIEQLGVERSRRAMEEAELILVVLDQSQPAREEDAAPDPGGCRTRPHHRGPEQAGPALPAGVDGTAGPGRLRPDLRQNRGGPGRSGGAGGPDLPRDPGSGYGELLTNQRQAEAAGRALESVRRAGEALDLGVTPDALLTDVEGGPVRPG